MGTNETLQAINGGSENAIDHRNKEHNLPSITNRDQDLPRVTPRDHELSKTAVRDHDLPRVTNRDQDLARVTSRDQEISKIANRDQDLPRVTSRDINTTIPMLIDQKVESEVVGQRENVPNQNRRTKTMPRKDGTLLRPQKKLHTQIKPNSTSIHSGLKDADIKVVKGIKESVILSDKPKAESHYKLQTVAGGLEVGNDNTLPSITNRDQDLSRITNRDHHLPRVTNKDQDLPSDINRDNSTSMKQVIKEFKESTEPTVQAVAAGSENGIDNNSTTMQMEPEFNSHSKKGPTSNFTATVTMKKKNETVFRNTPKFKIKPNFHGDPKPSKESSTSRHTLPHNTLNRSPRPKSTQQRKNGTIIRPPPKVSPQLKPKSTTILDGTKGRKHSTDDPKLVWSSKVPLSTDKATSQTNTAFPIAEVSEDSINQVGVQNVTSKGFIIIWVAPEGRFKNFVIRIIEENDEGVNEGDGSNQEKEEERTEGSEITTNVIEVVRRNSSNDGVRKKFTKLLPGSARSYPVIDLTAQTNYSVTLYGTGRGLRSNVHTFIITTGPEPPSHLSFSEITDTSLTVSWRRPKSSVSGFKVTYIHTKEGEPISVTVDSSNSNLALSKLSPGSTYEVSVISVLGLDESDPIKDFVITLPDPPTDLRAINITDTKALLLWRPALATVDQYIITYHSEEAPGSDLSVRVSGNAVEQQLQALKESTKYSVTIISRLGEQKSSSTLTTFTTTSGSPGKGEAPRDLIAKQVTARSAVLSWKPPASAVTSYKLTYFTKGGERKEVTLNPGVTEHELRRLRPSSTYTALLQGERGGVYTAAISTEFTTGALRFPYPSDCSQELMNGQKESGLVEIFPGGKQGQPVMVYCDMETDGGGWTVFQRRKDGKTNFFRSWQEYRKGFGDLEGEFWLGNDFLHNLTTMTPMNLRVDLRSGDEAVYAHYSTFSLDTMKKHYMLRVSGYSGTAGDSLKYHDKRPFSTFDRDPQPFITRCSMSYRGGWWYKNCHEANLNGLYNTHTNHQVEAPSGGFCFENTRRNAVLEAGLSEKGYSAPKARKTGTTIGGIIFKDGVILGADTRATDDMVVADKNCMKIHYIAPNIYCCGAGVAADADITTQMMSSNIELHSLSTGRPPLVVTVTRQLKQLLFRYQGHIGSSLIVGGVDVNGFQLFSIYPHGSYDRLPFAAMGSGAAAAISVFEDRYKPNMELEEGKQLVRDAIAAGIFCDLGSGSNIDLCVITEKGVDYLRGYDQPVEKGQKEGKYTYKQGTTPVLTKTITPLTLDVVEESVQMMDSQ
ncbi:hypothetical protein PHYPO_G00239360 [Pangasianodon hypophthalmus]|uniref:proteasome endopeptidase complex n=1 Tax=Pangasianodon hypophthalmus TaxID=310915 RepID=A0A5N5NF22_PANHP|nr:hypothetical protein PHYPO_G00239360 [Pangasianodon hypophthalmus]